MKTIVMSNSTSKTDASENEPIAEELVKDKNGEENTFGGQSKDDTVALVVPLSISDGFPSHLQKIINHADFYYGIAPLMAGDVNRAFIVEDALINLFGINQLKVSLVLEAPGMLPVNLVLEKPQFYKIIEYKQAVSYIKDKYPEYMEESDPDITELIEEERSVTNL